MHIKRNNNGCKYVKNATMTPLYKCLSVCIYRGGYTRGGIVFWLNLLPATILVQGLFLICILVNLPKKKRSIYL